MTREELVNSFEYKFTKASLEKMNVLYPTVEFQKERNAFDEGVEWCREWLEQHPHWHKYPEDKPAEIGNYFVAYNRPRYDYPPILRYSLDKKAFYESVPEDENYYDDFSLDQYIIAWMELPAEPKFD